MRVETLNASPGTLNRYAAIGASFEVRSVLRVVADGMGGIALIEEAVHTPYRKNIDTPEDSPLAWPPAGETGTFAMFLATAGSEAVGGAAVVTNPSGAFLFERRDTLAGLLDIRVRQDRRGNGVAEALLFHAAEWARQQGCAQMRIESQNTNVAACRFHAKYCELGGIERFGYAACPAVAHEVMLLWYLNLQAREWKTVQART